jgi:hypothetical protein
VDDKGFLYDKAFLSFVNKLEKISLGSTQRKFLSIIAQKPISAYDIHKLIKKEIDIKNVRKTVNRLRDLGLIEIEDYYPRNAIRFQLTSRGLFHLICDGPIPESILDKYRNDIVLQNILFNSFELETIREWLNSGAPFYLAGYIQKCCQAILASIQNIKSLSEQYDLDMNDRSEHLSGFLQTSLSPALYEFIIRILISTDMAWQLDDPTLDVIPKIALARDKEFVARARSIKKSFLKGCNFFMV